MCFLYLVIARIINLLLSSCWSITLPGFSQFHLTTTGIIYEHIKYDGELNTQKKKMVCLV